MSAKDLIIDPAALDLSQVVAGREEIGRYNPQRFEMAQLDAVVLEDKENSLCVGYKDVTNEEFWIRGHMPGMPVMPGVIICEAAAQLSGYFAQKYRFSPAGILLGVILGPIAEQGLRNVLVLSDDNPLPYFFTRWISVLLIVMIVAAIYFSLRPKAWEKVGDDTDAAEPDSGDERTGDRTGEPGSRAHPAE